MIPESGTAGWYALLIEHASNNSGELGRIDGQITRSRKLSEIDRKRLRHRVAELLPHAAPEPPARHESDQIVRDAGVVDTTWLHADGSTTISFRSRTEPGGDTPRGRSTNSVL